MKYYIFVESQSLFSWIHLSYIPNLGINDISRPKSQSLFSWIHLSYEGEKEWNSCFWKCCLNPYFPGFIFLMEKNLFWYFDEEDGLNPYFPGFIFLIN